MPATTRAALPTLPPVTSAPPMEALPFGPLTLATAPVAEGSLSAPIPDRPPPALGRIAPPPPLSPLSAKPATARGAGADAGFDACVGGDTGSGAGIDAGAAAVANGVA